MIRLSARKLINCTEEEIWSLQGTFELEFDNGVITTTGRRTSLSYYAWFLYKTFPKIPMRVEHHLQTHMAQGENFTSSSFVAVLESFVEDIHDAYPKLSNEERIGIATAVQVSTNKLYNVLIDKTAEYVGTIKINDIYQIMTHPSIVKLRQDNPVSIETINDEKLIDRIYKGTLSIAKNSPEFKQNNISIMLRSKLVKEDQTMQCASARGSITDLGSELFPYPVSRGYAEGFRDFHDSFIETRTAGMSLNNSKGQLKNVEFFSRKAQLVGMQLQRLHHYDCGSTHYTNWQVMDLDLCEGKYYLDAETKELKVISKKDTHLIGKIVKMRTIMNCMCPDPDGVCATCFGTLSRNIYKNTNLGHICTVTMTSINSQLVLSTKHVTGSATASKITLDRVTSDYFTVMENGFCYGLNKRLRGKDLKISISDEHLSNFVNVVNIDNIKDIVPENTTRIPVIEFIYKESDGTTARMGIGVEVDHNLSFMTMEALKYFRRMKEEGGGWYHDDEGNYVFDMSEWDYDNPFLELPAKQFNTYEFSKDISKHLESNIKDSKYRDTDLSPTTFLREFVDLVSTRLNLKLSVLETVAYTAMITSFANKDFALPKPWTKHGVGVLQTTMLGRSLSGAMAYQYHKQVFTSGETFLVSNRPNHPFDIVLMPDEVIKDPPPRYEYLDNM